MILLLINFIRNQRNSFIIVGLTYINELLIECILFRCICKSPTKKYYKKQKDIIRISLYYIPKVQIEKFEFNIGGDMNEKGSKD